MSNHEFEQIKNNNIANLVEAGTSADFFGCNQLNDVLVLNLENFTNDKNNDQLDELLAKFDLSEVKYYLIKAGVTYKSLQHLSKEDIKEAIPPIGLRAEFREKLFRWRKTEFGIEDDTLSISIANKVVSWLQNESFSSATVTSTHTKSTFPKSDCQLFKNIKLILQETEKGKALVAFYEKNGHLIEPFRADLINIILDNILARDVKLSPKDFPPLVDDIIQQFPNEIKEYYFIPRGLKKNPGGKLWDKYVNQRAKRKRTLDIGDKVETSEDVEAQNYTELDISILNSLKNSLARDSSDWGDVKDKWQRTFLLRQKELKSSATNLCK